MLAPYGIPVIDDCQRCPVRKKYFFCGMGKASLRQLSTITAPAVYPKGALLFVEGQSPRGVFVLCGGRAKLRSSHSGKGFISRICEAGSVLGLNAVLLHRPFESTAEMIEPGQANFIKTESLLQLARDRGDVAVRLAQQLGKDNHSTNEKFRILALTRSPAKRLANLVLSMLPETNQPRSSMQISLPFSQEEIGEMIGSTRETVARLFKILTTLRVIERRGSRLMVHDIAKLEEVCERATISSRVA